ncbi:uncharacterized protein KY384_003808 [Bacidia gigantensis]|uniref:uncharacterized protein n=1 Tax=Bacidia gigantensis TaxID=2732470 RepID=UPI001D0463B9|nr:uncharacterized protein KY384_003808 [Bacidia gigantensis]KAG8532168.1 hypothetical protein KY384_003808 [Bacidia gigantensis]
MSSIGSLASNPSRHTHVTTAEIFPAVEDLFEWNQSILDLCSQLYLKSAEDHSSKEMSLSWIVKVLHSDQLKAVLWYITILVEEATKIKSSAPEIWSIDQSVAAELCDIDLLLRTALEPPLRGNDGPPGSPVVFECFRVPDREDVSRKTTLKAIISLLLDCLDFDQFCSPAFDMFEDLLDRFPGFYDSSHLRSIAAKIDSPAGRRLILQLQEGQESDEATALVGLLIAYSDVSIQDIVRAQHSHDKGVKESLLEVMRCPGYLGVDDLVTPRLFETWTTYLGFLQEVEPDDSTRDAVGQLVSLIEICLNKSCWPADPEECWTRDERKQFSTCRKDIIDLFQTVYLVCGPDLFHLVARQAMESCGQSQWITLEASLVVLNGLSETSAVSEASIHKTVSIVLSSPIFEPIDIRSPWFRLRVKQERLNMILSYAAFFESYAHMLPACLKFVFQCLDDMQVGGLAAKCILRLTTLYRDEMTNDLETFLRVWKTIFDNEEYDSDVKETFTNAIAVIIQAQPTDIAKFWPLKDIISLIECRLNLGLDDLPTNHIQGKLKILNALRCVVRLGKGLQAPDELSIVSSEPSLNPQFWTQDAGKRLQEALLGIIELAIRTLPDSILVIESICDIFRAGYHETMPGLFVFPPTATAKFVLATNTYMPRLDYVFETAGMMLGTQSVTSDIIVQESAQSMLEHAKRIVMAAG